MKKNNKGFSLVELIIVIAIMAVLVGVLAPQFIKYVEQSRRSRDIQTAQEIREAVLAAIADGSLSGNADSTKTTFSDLDTISEEPVVSGNKTGDTVFTATYNPTNGTCYVEVGGITLTTESGASEYKSVD
jgi:prepilin-type N-terminal cleavage/methylation domain-containing protein